MNGKPQCSDKPVPRCLGRMVNLFDLTSSRNRLLTDKPCNNDGSSLSRSLSDESRMSNAPMKEMEDKAMIFELRRSSSSKKSNGFPVKMLMAEEMSNDLKSNQNCPNVVARLMGLDALPEQQPNINSEKQIRDWKEEHICHNNHIVCENHSNRVKSGNILERWKPSQRTSGIKNDTRQKGSSIEFVNEKLPLICQKFMEAKRFATDESLRQTREFQDALDVLSSNGDLFLEVLQEPNSFSEKLYGGRSIPSPPETKRITILRPSKVRVDEKFAGPSRRNDEHRRKQVQVNLWDTHNEFPPTMSTWKGDDSPPQPTRIVVLKPSALRVNDIFYEETEDEEAEEAGEVAKEITQLTRENLAGHWRDETLLSSVYSNGYTGDESSFDKSDNEFVNGNFGNSEVMSPLSRHSWEHLNRNGSPYSLSSFGRVSYSPESSVSREAKKRLSERWATMASNVEQRWFRKSSSTLGEMLALADMKKSEMLDEKDNNIERKRRGSTSCINNDVGLKGENVSPGKLLRSKSVPVSSYSERLNFEPSNAVLSRDGSRRLMKVKTSKSSFTGKVTSLFFPNRKTRKDKPGKPRTNVDAPLSTAETSGTSNNHSEMGLFPLSQPQSSTVMDDVIGSRLGQGISSDQDGYCVHDTTILEIQGENQDQPSPISVLEPPFEEDESSRPVCSISIDTNPYGDRMPPCIGKSKLIDKSPPIGSIARTLSWEESYLSTTTSYPSNSPAVSPSSEDDEGEMLSLVQSLLSMASLDDVEQLTTNMTEWCSPSSPLDPLLRDKYIDLSAKEPLPESRRRKLRSYWKLIFDCVNLALVDIRGLAATSSEWTRGCVGLTTHKALPETVWARVKEWCKVRVKLLSLDDGDSDSLVEVLVTEEVVGKGWALQMGLEVDNIGEEIEGKLLEQLIEEYLVD